MDDLYPNQGEWFIASEPPEQVSERSNEKSQAVAGKRIIEKMRKHFNEQIKILDSVSAIPDEVKTNPEEFMHTVAGYDIARQYLEGQKNYLEGLLED